MKKKTPWWAAGILLAVFSIAGVLPAHAAGLLVADGGFGGQLEIEEHSVQVTINNGIAVTEVIQVFRNTENRIVEALYTFPVPKGASVSDFSMWINGTEMTGEVVEKQRARQIYESYKETRKDPGLLEQVDYKTFELRIFPIAANAAQKVRIVYYQELAFDHDAASYVYPLATSSRTVTDSRTTGTFSLTLDVLSEIPITTINSPSHDADFVFADHTDNYVRASLEQESGDLQRDIVLNYELARPKTGLDIIATRAPGDDGYFMLTFTAGEDLSKLDIGMDYLFLLDISGSMRNDGKLQISQDSILAFINALSPEDRFELMTFNVQPNLLFSALTEVNDETLAQAEQFLGEQIARGGTVLNPAIQTAYKYQDPDRPLNVVILSDGMTEQNERTQLLNLIQKRPTNTRVFCIGIGNEVNRQLLEQLADDAGGLAAFISRGDDFQRQAQAFRRKLIRPAIANVNIQFEGANVYDAEPGILPNLYHGAPIRMYGRYKNSGSVTVHMTGEINGRAVQKSIDVQLPQRSDANSEVERMWAWKRIDQLLKEADRQGSRASAIDEIVRLGEGYSIVTEYTSFIVLENDAEYERWNIERKNLLRSQRDREQLENLKSQLSRMRDDALAQIGPKDEEEAKSAPPTATPTTSTPTGQSPQPQPTSPPSRGVDFDFGNGRSGGRSSGGGSGPVGPLVIGMAALMRRRRKRQD